jgi:hypothetical protein
MVGGRSVAPGTYLCHLQAEGVEYTRKMLKLKQDQRTVGRGRGPAKRVWRGRLTLEYRCAFQHPAEGE